MKLKIYMKSGNTLLIDNIRQYEFLADRKGKFRQITLAYNKDNTTTTKLDITQVEAIQVYENTESFPTFVDDLSNY